MPRRVEKHKNESLTVDVFFKVVQSEFNYVQSVRTESQVYDERKERICSHFVADDVEF